jgi:hypothetical protein
MGIVPLSAIPDDLFQSLPLGLNHLLDGLLAIDKWPYRTYLQKLRHHMQPFRALVLYTVLPQDILCLVRDMPQTALDDYLDLMVILSTAQPNIPPIFSATRQVVREPKRPNLR